MAAGLSRMALTPVFTWVLKERVNKKRKKKRRRTAG